ncbi:MAG: AmmeMemoRadiSam system radical SAM enzyme, partial [Thermodesulfovibrionales bacterium]|nr:AmmeMemoRadiSam system radical SAM enzyme [Thermodesulfovibrionales bacterium]
MKNAQFYLKYDDNAVKCLLCNHYCIIKNNTFGICKTRQNIDGVLYSLVYGDIVSFNIDPVEKKPLYHFLPGTLTFSIATRGCNFHCKHCQNASISQFGGQTGGAKLIEPWQVVENAINTGCKSISYTYTEPTVYFEYALDTSKIAKQKGLLNIFVSNGYTSKEAIDAIAPYLDANNIDLKGDDNFYKNICGARLQPILDTIKMMKEKGVWLEITTLVIPSLNDSDDFLYWAANFIKGVDPSIPW